MLLIYILAAVIILAGIIGLVLMKIEFDDAAITLWTLGVIILFILGIIGIVIFLTHQSMEADCAGMKETYTSLQYQVDNHMYNNTNEVGKKELFDQITEWNRSLKKVKILSKNKWFSVFYPIDYEQFDYISYELIEEVNET